MKLTVKQSHILARIHRDGLRHWPDLKPGSETHRAIVALTDLGLIEIKQGHTVADGHIAVIARPRNV